MAQGVRARERTCRGKGKESEEKRGVVVAIGWCERRQQQQHADGWRWRRRRCYTPVALTFLEKLLLYATMISSPSAMNRVAW